MKKEDTLKGVEFREEKWTETWPEAERIKLSQRENQWARQDRQLGGEGDRLGVAGWAAGGCVVGA